MRALEGLRGTSEGVFSLSLSSSLQLRQLPTFSEEWRPGAVMGCCVGAGQAPPGLGMALRRAPAALGSAPRPEAPCPRL